MKIRLSLNGAVVSSADHRHVANLIDGVMIDGVYEDDIALYARCIELTPIDAWRFHAIIDLHALEAALENVFSQMPQPDQAKARARMKNSLTYDRFDPLVEQLGRTLGLTNEQLDDLWRDAALL